MEKHLPLADLREVKRILYGKETRWAAHTLNCGVLGLPKVDLVDLGKGFRVCRL